jgi:hypothetical protein
MYSSPSLTELRQGDIIEDFYSFGPIAGKDFRFPGFTGATQMPTIDAPTKQESLAVLSYCCDVSTANGAKVKAVLLAPLRRLIKAAPPKDLDLIRRGNDVGLGPSTFTNLFYLSDIGALPECVIDFRLAFSVGPDVMGELLRRKVAQLDEPTREKLQMKLAFFFGVGRS